jgi:antitoxin MazE
MNYIQQKREINGLPAIRQGAPRMEHHTRMHTIKLVPIGNSKGVRIPSRLIKKYGFLNGLVLEETEKGLLLREAGDGKLSWEKTFQAMAEEKECWDDFEPTLLDGLENDDDNF